MNAGPKNKDPLLSVADAARYLGVGRKILYQLIDFEEIPAFKVGPSIRIRQSDLDAFRQSGRLT